MRASSAATTTRAAPDCARALRDAHDHRQAADVGQRLARQPRRGQPRRDQDVEAHASALRPRRQSSAASARASLSSITGMPSRTGKARRSAWQTSSWRSCCRRAPVLAAAPCRSGRPAVQAGGFPCAIVRVRAAAGSSAAAPRRTPGSGSKSSVATQTRVAPIARRVELDGVLLGDDDVGRVAPARAASRSRDGRAAGSASIVEAGARAASRRSAAGRAMPAAATTRLAAQRLERRPRSAARRATSRRARPTPASARRAEEAGQRRATPRRRCRARAGAAGSAPRHRLAQRPGRQQPAVAGAALVEHQHLDVARRAPGAAGRRR